MTPQPDVSLFSPQNITAVFILIGILAGLKMVVDKLVFDKEREKRRNTPSNPASPDGVGAPR